MFCGFSFWKFIFLFLFYTIAVSDYVEYIWNGGGTFTWSIHIRNIFSIYKCSSKYTKIYSLVYLSLQIQCGNGFYFKINRNIFKIRTLYVDIIIRQSLNLTFHDYLPSTLYRGRCVDWYLVRSWRFGSGSAEQFSFRSLQLQVWAPLSVTCSQRTVMALCLMPQTWTTLPRPWWTLYLPQLYQQRWTLQPHRKTSC